MSATATAFVAPAMGVGGQPATGPHGEEARGRDDLAGTTLFARGKRGQLAACACVGSEMRQLAPAYATRAKAESRSLEDHSAVRCQ